jgi:hypothetical protein
MRAQPERARRFVQDDKERGITDCSLSNNHVLDFGDEGLNDTIAALSMRTVLYR